MTTLSPEDTVNEPQQNQTQQSVPSSDASLPQRLLEADGRSFMRENQRKRVNATVADRTIPNVDDQMMKKRKTTDRQEMPSQSTSVNDRQQPPPPPPNTDLMSENINVIFEDDTQMSDDVDQADQNAGPNEHDRRQIIRHIFRRCFTSSSQDSFNVGAVIVECSDEE